MSDEAQEQPRPTGRGVPVWALLAAVLAAALLGGLVVVFATRSSDEAADSTTTTVTLPESTPIDSCFEELYPQALSFGESNGDSEANAMLREIAMTYGIQSEEYDLLIYAGGDYKGRALQEGRADAAARLEQDIRDGCTAIEGLTPDTTAAAPPETTTTDGPASVPGAADPLDEARATAQAVIDAWQAGDTTTLEAISGFNVPSTLGAPDPTALLSGCALENPPLGSGTPSDPSITAVCTISTEPPTFLWLGPATNGDLRVLDASLVGD